MAATTNVTGLIGTVDGLWEKIDAELQAREWNWKQLSAMIPIARQYLEKACEVGQMNATLFRRLVDIFGWKVSDVMQLEWQPDDTKDTK